MAFFYVKAGGTCAATSGDGRETTARTGTWTATTGDYYDTLSDAVATGKPNDITDGDVICLSDESSDVIPGNVEVNIPGGVTMLTVDNDAVDTYAEPISAQITSTAVNDGYIVRAAASTSNALVYGINIASKDHMQIQNGSTGIRAVDYSFSNTNARYLNVTGPRGTCEFVNFHLSGNTYFGLKDTKLSWLGGTFDSDNTINFVGTGFSNRIVCDGVDFSGSPGPTLVRFNTTAQTSDNNSVEFRGCQLPLGWSFLNDDLNERNVGIAAQCDSQYQWYLSCKSGEIDFVTNVSYNAHDTLDDGLTRGSFEFDTSPTASGVSPLSMGYEVGAIPKCLSAINTEAASKKKVRIRFVPLSGDSLNDADVVFYVGVPSAANGHQRYWVTHYNCDPGGGSALSTETTSGNWTGPGLATNAYYLDVDMGNPGNGRVMVIPGVCKPNVTVYVSWQLEFVA